MKKHQARKRFGQHFLRDTAIIQDIVRAISLKQNQGLVEIGPGLGALTMPLLERYGKLTAVELDRDVIPHLERRCAEIGKLQIYQADALRFNFRDCLLEPEQSLQIVGNLPYNISTPLLFHLFQQSDVIDAMTFMLQKEVVDRLAADPGTPHYGRLSVMAQYACQIESLFNVSPEAFEPPPDVMSAVVRLKPYKTLPFPAKNFETFAYIVREAFNQRRKTLQNSLKKLISKEDLIALGISPAQRAETLTFAQFVHISNMVINLALF